MAFPPRLSLEEFEELSELFNREAGLHFDASALSSFQRRLGSRLPVREVGSFREYARALKFGTQSASELAAALDLITSGETYFFRHEEQLSVLKGPIFRQLARANASSRRLAVWSAGCSTGEEAYTVAIMAKEYPAFRNYSIRIIGNDLSHERVEHARQACYFRGAFRSTPEGIRERYFHETGRFWQVRSEIRELCHFSPLNLLTADAGAFMGRFDIILCRNVLIYLDETARVQVLENLYDRLVPGGYLLLGHSESLKFLDTPLDLEGVEHDMAYQRPLLPHSRRGSR